MKKALVTGLLAVIAAPSVAVSQQVWDSASIDFIGFYVPILAEDQPRGSDTYGVVLHDKGAIFHHHASGADAIMLAGWPCCDVPEIVPSQVALIVQGNDGLELASSTLLESTQINGTGAPVVADFDRNGADDIFLPGFYHGGVNDEAVPSTVYFQNLDGTFRVERLQDSINAHDAQLYTDGDTLKVITSTFTAGGLNQPIYTVDRSGGFSWEELSISYPSAMARSVADLNDDGDLEVVMGSFNEQWLPGGQGDRDYFHIGIVDFDYYAAAVDTITGTPDYEENVEKYYPYHANRPDEFCDIQSSWGRCSNHGPRVWLHDINFDGAIDILTNSSLWPAPYSKLQVLLNDGEGRFTDVTDTSNPDTPDRHPELDYLLNSWDIDGSGIPSLLAAGHTAFVDGSSTLSAATFLLNDGTGRLHRALSGALYNTDPGASSICDRLVSAAQQLEGVEGWFGSECLLTPYRDRRGGISFMALVGVGSPPGVRERRTALFDVWLGFDPTTDYQVDMIVAERNGTDRVRTFAGDDRIHRTDGDPSASINGGLGDDVYVADRSLGAYNILAGSEGFTVVDMTNGAIDRLAGVETLEINDNRWPLASLAEGETLSAINLGRVEWLSDANESVRSILRLTGLHSAMPHRIMLALNNDAANLHSGRFIDCILEPNPARYSNGEYLIVGSDFAACGSFSRADADIIVVAHEDDVANGIELRRFTIAPSSDITDLGFDAASGSNALSASLPSGLDADTLAAVSFGPFEWVGDANSTISSSFRLSGVRSGVPDQIDLAIDNAASGTYDGDFSDCRLNLPSSAWRNGELTFNSGSLAECGDFGRADLRFRIITSRSDIEQGLFLRRIAVSGGGVTDFHYDQTTSNGTLVSASNGKAVVEFGPFQWVGDANAPTANVFRLAGVASSAPTAIDIAIENASSGGFNGDFNDCALSIRQERYSGADFIIGSDDLGDCGAFGRGDLRLRFTVDTADHDHLSLRRFGVNGFGLTDFAFDAAPEPNSVEVDPPASAPAGSRSFTFGPFEWTGSSTASTQNVFRLSGLSAMPVSIEVSLDDAVRGVYSGEFSDCSIILRNNRLGDGEYVLSSADLADCGDFGRADAEFRITLAPTSIAGPLSMRRFAVTTGGGLTDFGFDN